MSFSQETLSPADLEGFLLARGLADVDSVLSSVGCAADFPRAFASFQTLCGASNDSLSLARLEADPKRCEAIWTILGGSQALSDALVHLPEPLDLLLNSAWLEHPRTPEQARAACRDFCFGRENRRSALGSWREQELLRIALRDLVLSAPSSQTTLEIALLAGACLNLAFDEVESRLRSNANSPDFAVLALGDFGGLEMHFSSDLDVAFVFDSRSNLSNQNDFAAQFARELAAYLSGETQSGAGWNVNIPFHPRDVLVFSSQTLDDFLSDPRSGFGVPQRQTLTRARFAAGNSSLGARAMTSIRAAAHPPGWDFDWNDELLRNKERAEREQEEQAGDIFDVNGTGTLGDIEWAASWTALKHGHDVSTLQTSNTRAQLLAARGANLLAGVESGALLGAYDWFRRVQLRLQIAREGASSVRRDSPDFAIWARAMLPTQPKEDAPVVFEETWRAHAQNVRMIFERVRDML